GACRPNGGPLRPAHDRCADQGARPAGGRVMLWGKNGQRDDLVVRGARVVDPAEGIDTVCDVRVDDGTVSQLGTNLDTNEHPVVDGEGPGPAPAFGPPYATPA